MTYENDVDQKKFDSEMTWLVEGILAKVDELAKKYKWSDEHVGEMIKYWTLEDAWLDYVEEGK